MSHQSGKKMVRRKLSPEEIKERKKQQKQKKKRGSTIDFSVGEKIRDNTAAVNSPEEVKADKTKKDADPSSQIKGESISESKSQKSFVKSTEMTNPAVKFNENKRAKEAREKKAEEFDPDLKVDYYSTSYEKKEKDKRFKLVAFSVLTLEIVILAILFIILFSLITKISNKDFGVGLKEESNTASESKEGQGSSGNSGSVNVDDDEFALNCSKVKLTDDSEGNPACILYFTYTNKLSEALSMSEVFVPIVEQEGEKLETFAPLEEAPEEFYNKDTKIADGNSIDVCYTVKLKNKTSPVKLTIHDNYRTFSDIGSVEIALQ
ncbi:MAG: DUF5067 domain-containing protein [Lachnospiraceae bacterium]|nr:DUF5067 domain-containing protein [Lachnospiraceae bacterium]